MNYYDTHLEEVAFDTLSGVLTVKKKQDLYEMDFPAYELKPKEVTSAMEDAIGARPVEAYMGRDLLCIFESEDVVRGQSFWKRSHILFPLPLLAAKGRPES